MYFGPLDAIRIRLAVCKPELSRLSHPSEFQHIPQDAFLWLLESIMEEEDLKIPHGLKQCVRNPKKKATL
jgi:hypothetical protein